MSSSDTQGFDVVYQMSSNRFLGVLRSLFIDDLPLSLGRVDLTIPLPGPVPNLTQTGFAQFGRPTAGLALNASGGMNAFTLTLSFTGVRLSLDPVPASLTFTGLAGLGLTGNAATTVTLQLDIDTTTSGASSPITITANSIAMTNLAPLPAGIPFPVGANLAQMTTAIQTEVRDRVLASLGAIFPFEIPINLPATGPCDIRPRQMQMRFIPGSTERADALAFMLQLRTASSGDISAFTLSRVQNTDEGVLMVANSLLRDLICCILPRAAGLPPGATEGNCCRWRNLTNVNIGGTTFSEVPLLEVCLNDGISFAGQIIQRGTGWWMRATFTSSVSLRNSSGTITPVVGMPSVTHEEFLEWWVWVLLVVAVLVAVAVGIVVGALLGGWVGAIIGGVSGLIIGLVIAIGIGISLFGVAALAASVVGPALAALGSSLQTLRLLPDDLTARFGSLAPIGDPIIDDVRVRGRVTVPEWRPARVQSSDQALAIGEQLDLDNGIVYPTGAIGGDADLIWDMGPGPHGDWRKIRTQRLQQELILLPSLATRGSARSIVLHGVSFMALQEDDLRELIYPFATSRVPSLWIPYSSAGAPDDPLVLAVRTSEGRYAKCAVWADGARLHIRYRTYDTAALVTLSVSWSMTQGEEIPSVGGVVFANSYLYEVSHRGAFTASAPSLIAPVHYQWTWNGTALGASGLLGGSAATYVVTGSRCAITTEMGQSLRGELCVTASDSGGLAVTACRDVDLLGTVRYVVKPSIDISESDFRRFFRPPPLPEDFIELPEIPIDEQLPQAFARGMDLPVEKVLLR